MKLQDFFLKRYKVLNGTDIDFEYKTPAKKETEYKTPAKKETEDSHTITLLVGVNGSGKSTVLKALFEILYKRGQVSFPFKLTYTLAGGNQAQGKRQISIEKASSTSKTIILKDEQQPIDSENEQAYLPERIVVFTTGNEADWEELYSPASTVENDDIPGKEQTTASLLQDLNFNAPKQVAIHELPGRPVPEDEPAIIQQLPEDTEESNPPPDQLPESRFLFIRSTHMHLLTLCGLLADIAQHPEHSDRRLQKVLNEAQLVSFNGFSLKFRINAGNTNGTESEEVKQLVAQLKKVATQSLRMGTDFLLFFDLTEQIHERATEILASAMLREQVPAEARGLLFFERLVHFTQPSQNLPPILREVNLFFKRSSANDADKPEAPLLLFDWLSDGERSFLGRMSLFSILGGTESLVLLDEPEVHFNDYWKQQIVLMITHALKGHPSHAVVTTHSSITLTDVKREDVIVLSRNGTFTSDVFRPPIRTYGADPSDIIIHVFGAPQASGAYSVEQIQNALRYSPADLSGKLRERKIEELEDLLEKVGPGFLRYQIRWRLANFKKDQEVL